MLANMQIAINVCWGSKRQTHLHDRQIVPTNYFVDKGKEANIKCEHFTKLLSGLHEIFGLHSTNLSCFVVCFNVVQLRFYFDKTQNI